MPEMIAAIGLMSGTSMDGIDVAMIATDGEDRIERGPSMTFEYESAFRNRLRHGMSEAVPITERTQRPGSLAGLEHEITARHARAVRAFLDTNRMRPTDIDVIGFHGQTVLHRPDDALTVQLGDGQALADDLGIRVVYDMRANDMALGGQGAPLVPGYHRALAASLPPEIAAQGPAAFVNIGGISNVTWVSGTAEPVAFDSGPGNALIDQWVQAVAGIPYDDQGMIASEGAADDLVVAAYLASPFFLKRGPKSLDRGDFTLDPVRGLEAADGAATLAKVTAAAILKAAEAMPQPPRAWIVCGGGRRNRAIMRHLAAGAGDATVLLAEEAGFNGDAMEAEAWAWLAVRSLRGLPLTWPETTGVMEPATGGVLAVPRDA